METINEQIWEHLINTALQQGYLLERFIDFETNTDTAFIMDDFGKVGAWTFDIVTKEIKLINPTEREVE